MFGAAMSERVIAAFAAELSRYRRLSEGAAEQLTWLQLREPLDGETNSIAVIMKHVAGNLRSRWTEPFTTDGEKPWRNRDQEFVDDFESRDALTACWERGWQAVESSLASMEDADLGREIMIRGEPHTLALALSRSLSHTAYHAGQIVQAARVLASRAGANWRTLTIARGQSAAFNAERGFDPSSPHR
jgi:hypothetical protein